MGNQTVSAKEGEEVLVARPRQNPAWIYNETVLLLDLYLRVGCEAPNHPAVIEASNILRHLGRERGVTSATTYRNPEGVAMKLKAMAQQDPEWVKRGLKGLRPVAIDALVWCELASDPDALAARKARIMADPQKLGVAAFPRSSHGPVPSFGPVSGERMDGETILYLLRLEGPVQALFAPRRVDPPRVVAKIGRTNEIARRVAQLSAGFPPTSNLSWTVIDTVVFESAVEAHRAERSLLDTADAQQWSIGGEFVIAPEARLVQLLREAKIRARERT